MWATNLKICTQNQFEHNEYELATSELWEALGKPDFNSSYSKLKVTLFKRM